MKEDNAGQASRPRPGYSRGRGVRSCVIAQRTLKFSTSLSGVSCSVIFGGNLTIVCRVPTPVVPLN